MTGNHPTGKKSLLVVTGKGDSFAYTVMQQLFIEVKSVRYAGTKIKDRKDA